MKYGILGGTFNPLHNGHLVIAEHVRSILNLDMVLFIPTFYPAHKEMIKEISDKERYNLLLKGLSGNPFFIAEDIELKKHQVSHSIDTIRSIKRKYNGELYFIIGSDLLPGFPEWKDSKLLTQEVIFVIIERSNFYIKKEFLKPFDKNFIEIKNIPYIEISSTMIRNYIKKGFSIRYLVPEQVESLINKKRLYR